MKPKLRWKLVVLVGVIGGIAIVDASVIYTNGKVRQALRSCLKVNPDGSEEVLSGEDCSESTGRPLTKTP